MNRRTKARRLAVAPEPIALESFRTLGEKLGAIVAMTIDDSKADIWEQNISRLAGELVAMEAPAEAQYLLRSFIDGFIEVIDSGG